MSGVNAHSKSPQTSWLGAKALRLLPRWNAPGNSSPVGWVSRTAGRDRLPLGREQDASRAARRSRVTLRASPAAPLGSREGALGRSTRRWWLPTRSSRGVGNSQPPATRAKSRWVGPESVRTSRSPAPLGSRESALRPHPPPRRPAPPRLLLQREHRQTSPRRQRRRPGSLTGPNEAWRDLLAAHWGGLLLETSFPCRSADRGRLVRYLVFFALELRTRRGQIAGIQGPLSRSQYAQRLRRLHARQDPLDLPPRSALHRGLQAVTHYHSRGTIRVWTTP